MATAGFAEHLSSPTGTAADVSRLAPGAGAAGCRSGPNPPESGTKKCPACAERRPGGSPAACPLCPARRVPGSEERLRRRSDPERGGGRAGRRDCDCRRELFVCPALLPKSADVLSDLTGKHKVLVSDDRDEARRRSSLTCRDEPGPGRRAEEPGVLSDSENEEPISRRIRNISAFIRKTKNSSAFSSGSQRSQSCTDPMEDQGGKMKVLIQPAAVMERVGISHSSAAGILLSSENSRSVSAPITAPDRRLTWRAVLTSCTPLGVPLPRTERSISPESNDSISEELNHFKPIVCSPCTPPKRLPDGRLMEPTIVKSTPRNLTRGLQKVTSYEASPAVLQKWRQIELDRQSLKVTSKATLTSPVSELHSRPDGGGGATKTRQHRAADGTMSSNKRKLLFYPPAGDTEDFKNQSVKIRVPAIRYSGSTTLRGCSEPVGGPAEFGGGPAPLCRKHSFSPYANDSGKLVPKDWQPPRKDCDSSIHNQATSRRGRKRIQKTKHLDPDLKKNQLVSPEALGQIQQDRALALKLQRQFDLERQSLRTSPNRYFLRSWRSTQNRRRRGLRRSRRISKKH